MPIVTCDLDIMPTSLHARPALPMNVCTAVHVCAVNDVFGTSGTIIDDVKVCSPYPTTPLRFLSLHYITSLY